MKLGAILLAGALALAGCGGGSGKDETAATAPTQSTVAAGSDSATLPPGTVEPPDTAEEQAEGPAAAEASPEAPASGPESKGDLPSADRSQVVAAVSDYIAALDRHDAARVCALLVPGSLDPGELPEPRAGCRPSLRASIGTRPRSGGPAWRRTTLAETKAEDLGDGRGRVSATVVHHFSDRKYVSVEDDVIYLEKAGGRWLIAKPSATFYRAVGYREPPLRAFAPPAGW
jgi:hypothetical protein